MGKQLHTETLLTRLLAAEKRIAVLERARPVSGAAISQGNLDVRAPNGESVLRAGQLPYGDDPAYGLEVRRLNGGLQARFFDTDGGGGYAAIFDSEGNVIFSEDTASNQGIATPYLAYRVMPYSEVLTPAQNTVSATFEKLHRITAQKAQPWVRTYLIINTTADTTAQVVLTQGGVQISSILDLPVSTNGYFWLDAPVDGGHMSTLLVDVEARRVAGTGPVRVAVAIATGRQS